MDINENISFVQRILDFMGIEHRDISIINFIILVLIIAYMVKKIYNFYSRCSGLRCDKITNAVSKTTVIERKVSELETILTEIKTEAVVSHDQLRRDLDRFDRYLEELQKNTFELHGIILGSGQNPKDISKRRIRHHDD